MSNGESVEELLRKLIKKHKSVRIEKYFSWTVSPISGAVQYGRTLRAALRAALRGGR
jgi:hypothetical protein